jgi:poly(A) polymerase
MQNLRFPSQANILCEILARVGYKARIVGGYIRDSLQGLTPYEIDMATDAPPDLILNICKTHNIKCIPTGLQHGTVTAIIRGETIEITTLRRDITCDGRHAEVIFTDSWEEDAKRRDFTINAMYLDGNLQLYDFFGGQKDLHENIVRFIGNPEQRIHEDYLRILRYFRFLGYFANLNLHPESFDAAVMLSHNLSKISSERIHSELLKIFSSRAGNIPIKLMLEGGIFQIIGLNFTNINVDKLYFGNDALVNLSIMMHLSDIRDTAILKKLKFSNAEQKLVNELLKYKLDNHFKSLFEKMILDIDITIDIEKMLQTIGKNIYYKLFEVYFSIHIRSFIGDSYGQVLKNFLAIIDSITLAECPVTARDIIDIGYVGSDIGHKLRLAKQLWIENNCKLEKNLLIKLIQQ